MHQPYAAQFLKTKEDPFAPVGVFPLCRTVGIILFLRSSSSVQHSLPSLIIMYITSS